MSPSQGGRAGSQLDVQVGEKLRYYRLSRDLTLSALAAQIDLSYQQLQKYETGANRISAGMLAEIASILKVPISKFFPQETKKGGTGNVIEPVLSQLQTKAISLLGEEHDVKVLRSVINLLLAVRR